MTVTIVLVAVTAVAACDAAAVGAVRVPSAGPPVVSLQAPPVAGLPGLPRLPAVPKPSSTQAPLALPAIPSLPLLPSSRYLPTVPPSAAPQTFAPLPGVPPVAATPVAARERPASAPVDRDTPSREGVATRSDGQGNGYLLGQRLRTAGVSAASSKRITREARRLRATLTNLEGCLHSLTGLERRVLVLLAGLQRRRAYSRAEVAARLDISRRRVGRVKRRGLRRLRSSVRTEGCTGGTTAGVRVATAAAFSTYPAPQSPAGAAGPQGSRGLVQSFMTPGRGDVPFTPPLPETLPEPADAMAIGATWVIVLLALAGVVLFALVAREPRRPRNVD